MNTAGIWAWLKETWTRLFNTASPGYFKVWNKIYALIIVLPQVPYLLTETGIKLPAAWDGPVNKIISIAGVVGFLMSKLTAKDATAIAADTSNNKLQYTAEKDLGISTPPKKD